MSRLCFGTIFTIINQCQRGQSANKLFESLMMIIGDSTTSIDPSSVTRRAQGKEELPEEPTESFINKSHTDLVVGFSNNVVKYFDPNKKECFVLAVKDILENDSTIPNDRVIGRDSNYTKQNILESNTFSLIDLLVNVFIYAISVSNTDCEREATELKKDKDYVASFMSRREEIHLSDKLIGDTSSLKLTIKTANFDSVFKEITSATIPYASNPTFVKFYQLNLLNKSFGLTEVSDFVKSNLARYVFSRKEYKDLLENDPDVIGIDAIKKYNAYVGDDSKPNNFGEIMIYSFLESVLHAPKLMSAIEISEAKSFYKKSNSSSIHFLSSDALKNKYQLIFGAVDVNDDLSKTINNSMLQVYDIHKNISLERTFISQNILETSFDESTQEFLKKLLIPTRGSRPVIDSAIGIFIGYSLNMPEKKGVSNEEYADLIMQQVETDIRKVVDDIRTEFDLMGFDDNYSFYVFVLPFENAEKDSKAIINKATKTSAGGSDNV